MSASRPRTWEQFFRFGFVGILGFAVDAAVLSLALTAHTGLLPGRCLSYVAAASCTWLLNRRWTFNDRCRSPVKQWVRFLAANSCGGAVNYGTYAFLVLHSSTFALYPVFAVAIGSISGLAINFLLSKYVVFEVARSASRTAST